MAHIQYFLSLMNDLVNDQSEKHGTIEYSKKHGSFKYKSRGKSKTQPALSFYKLDEYTLNNIYMRLILIGDNKYFSVNYKKGESLIRKPIEIIIYKLVFVDFYLKNLVVGVF